MPKELLHPMIESKFGLLPSGDIQWEIAHAATMEDFQAGRLLWTKLVLAKSPQRPDAGIA